MSAARNVFGSLALVIGAGVVAYAIFVANAQKAADENSARAAGFATHSEQTSAAALGAKTPEEWKARLAEEAERKRIADEQRGKAEVERQRQWEADAPKRAVVNATTTQTTSLTVIGAT